MAEGDLAAAETSFGAWIQQRRKALSLTQEELAQRVGCSLSAVRKIEGDERRPSRQVAELLAEHLRVLPEQRELFLRVARAEVRVDRLPPPTPGLQPGPARLPIPPTPLVGREPELAALGRLLADPNCRLLTVVGPGGIGKTRLVIEAASRQQAAFPDGACFVSLAALNSPGALVSVVAGALGFAFQGPAEPRQQLFNHLREQVALLVLDNVEHLLEGAGLFAELLECAPRVKLLVTSRERLKLKAEWAFELQGLPIPPAGQAEGLDEYSAYLLFVRSAQRAQAAFALNAEERASVARICQLMEGLPLGIELAAAWTPVLTCRQIAHEIERSLDFLAAATRDAPARHQSLRATFDYSWHLLSTDERDVLRRLAVFQGGFERDAAEQVAGASLRSLSELVSKSLVRRSESGRYDLHEAIRQYAAEHLAADAPAEAETRTRHGCFYLALLKDRESTIKGAAQQQAVQELTRELDNERLAWAWGAAQRQWSWLRQALLVFWGIHDFRGLYQEGIEQLELVAQAVRAGGASDPAARALLGHVLVHQGWFLFRLGRLGEAQALMAQGLAQLRALGDRALLAQPLIQAGLVAYHAGQLAQAAQLTDEALSLAEASGDMWSAAWGHCNQGIIANALEDHGRAYECLRAGLAGFRASGDPRLTAIALIYLGTVAAALGRYDEAQAVLEESLTLSAQLGDRLGMGSVYSCLGTVALAREDFAKAEALFEQALELFTRLGTPGYAAQALAHLATTAAANGETGTARRQFLGAARRALQAQALPVALEAALGLAHVEPQADSALELVLHVLGQQASTRGSRSRAEQLRARLEAQLEAELVEAAKTRARQRTLDALLAEISSTDNRP